MRDIAQKLIKYGLDDGVKETMQFEGKGKPGRPYYAYDDGRGNQTIGYGTLITPDVSQLIGDDVASGKKPIEPGLARQLLDLMYTDSIKGARKYVGDAAFDRLTPRQQMTLVDMHYNLGANKLAGFENMQEAIQAGDMNRAREELRDSEWYKQTGNRSRSHYDKWLIDSEANR